MKAQLKAEIRLLTAQKRKITTQLEKLQLKLCQIESKERKEKEKERLKNRLASTSDPRKKFLIAVRMAFSHRAHLTIFTDKRKSGNRAKVCWLTPDEADLVRSIAEKYKAKKITKRDPSRSGRGAGSGVTHLACLF